MALSLLDLLLVLSVAFVAGRVAQRLGYPSVLGEIGAGILLGPPLLGLLVGSDALAIVAELGVLLMMIYIGMEIDLRDIGRASSAGILAGVGGFVVPFGAAYLVAIAFGIPPAAAVFVGIGAGITSLATKSRILVDLGLLDTRIAHVMLAGALIADTLALIAFAGVMSVDASGSLDVAGVALVAGRIVAFFLLAGLLGRYAVPALFRKIATLSWVGRAGTLTLVVITGLVFAEMAELAGLHGILGAFLAGLFIRDAIRLKRLSVDLTETVKNVSLGFLAPVFFVTAGFEVSFAVFRDALPLLLSVVAVATVGKVLGSVLFSLPSKQGWREGVTVGLGMNGRGGVDIIIAGIGLQAGIIDTTVFSVLVFMAILTTAFVPAMLTWAVRWLDRHGELIRSDGGGGLVLLVGAGPLARRVAALLAAHRPVRLLDLNVEHVVHATADGLDAIQGDALDADTLVRAGVEDAGTLLAVTPNAVVNVLVAQRAREGFIVPRVAALLSPNVDKGLLDTLLAIGGRPLLGGPIDVGRWTRVALDPGAEIVELDAEAARLAAGTGTPDAMRELLPLVVQRGDVWQTFVLDDILEGDRVFALRDPGARRA